MSYSPDKYKLLKKAGYTAKEAHKFASMAKEKVTILFQDKILTRLESGEKFTRKFARQVAREFGFSPTMSDKIKSYGAKNLYNVLLTKSNSISEEKAVRRFFEKEYGGIKLISAAKAKIAYRRRFAYIFSYHVDTGFSTDIRYATIDSNKKLTIEEATNRVIEEVLLNDQEEENYGGGEIDYSSFRLEDAYYITDAERKEIREQRNDKNARKKAAHNNSRKKK